MIKKALDYAERMHELKIAPDTASQANDIFLAVPQVRLDFENPSVPLTAKHRVIEKVFPEKIRDFLKVLCDNDDVELWDQILEAYGGDSKKDGALKAVLSYVTPPSEEELAGIRNYVAKRYGRDDVDLVTRQDPSLGSGFTIQIGNDVIDWSANGRIRQIQEKIREDQKKFSLSGENIISILRSEIEEFDLTAKEMEVGTVTWVGDGIANIDGIDHAVYGEIVLFDCGVKGMVQDIRRDEIGCILFGRDTEICEGSRVVRTGKRAGVPVGDGFKGRVIDALGAPIDGAGPIKEDGYRPVEEPAPSIVDRQSVSEPLETGILSIDSMFPIGRGQRELIIGDRQTGKTAIALDTILNQKDQNVVCIYVAIGQKASSVAQLVQALQAHDALRYTIVLCAAASDSAPLQYIAPYAGCAMGEYFMHQGRDVLIVYDDLSKHAVAYRALSLLLKRSPGREAYPGDVFYLHSRLLERAAHLADHLGGGSMTALPIVETQAGDVSAYIPTNIISITDGQIFLESSLFFAGQRPAVNVGLSVSRVGGAAQTKAMKKAAGAIRLELAQYREMEVFMQFSSDLDDATRRQLAYGQGLMQLLRQEQSHPYSQHAQVLLLVSALGHVFLPVPPAQVRSTAQKLLAALEQQLSALCSRIDTTGQLTDGDCAQILDAAKRFIAQQLNPDGEH